MVDWLQCDVKAMMGEAACAEVMGLAMIVGDSSVIRISSRRTWTLSDGAGVGAGAGAGAGGGRVTVETTMEGSVIGAGNVLADAAGESSSTSNLSMEAEA